MEDRSRSASPGSVTKGSNGHTSRGWSGRSVGGGGRTSTQPSLLSVDWIEVEVEPEGRQALSHGEVFTQSWVVELILDLAGYTADKDLATMCAVEPACGSGAFLVPMARRLSLSSRRHGRSICDAANAVYAVDLNPEHVEAARITIAESLLAEGWAAAEVHTATAGWLHEGDFILGPDLTGTADFVLGNPPYVRPEEVAPSRLKRYREACPTMGGRADLFVGFFEKGLRHSRPGAPSASFAQTGGCTTTTARTSGSSSATTSRWWRQWSCMTSMRSKTRLPPIRRSPSCGTTSKARQSSPTRRQCSTPTTRRPLSGGHAEPEAGQAH